MPEDTQPNESRVLPKGAILPSIRPHPKPLFRAPTASRSSGHLLPRQTTNSGHQHYQNWRLDNNVTRYDGKRPSKNSSAFAPGWQRKSEKERSPPPHRTSTFPTHLPDVVRRDNHTRIGTSSFTVNSRESQRITQDRHGTDRQRKRRKAIRSESTVEVPNHFRKGKEKSHNLGIAFENETANDLRRERGAIIHEQRNERELFHVSYSVPTGGTPMALTTIQDSNEVNPEENSLQPSGSCVKLEDLDERVKFPFQISKNYKNQADAIAKIGQPSFQPSDPSLYREQLADFTRPSRQIRSGRMSLTCRPCYEAFEPPQPNLENTPFDPSVAIYVSDTPSPPLRSTPFPEVDEEGDEGLPDAAYSVDETTTCIEQLSRDSGDKVRRLFVSGSRRTLLAVSMHGGIHALERETSRWVLKQLLL